MQLSFHKILSGQNTEEEGSFLAQLKERLFRGQEEAEQIHQLSLKMLGSGVFCPELVALSEADPSIHSLMLECLRHEEHQYGSNAGLVLRFLHLLCEGHNLLLQNFIRHQHGAKGSLGRRVDLVTAVASFASFLAHRLNPFTVRLSEAAWLALAEFVQSPCRPNQRLLVDTPLPTQANAILSVSEKTAVQAVKGSTFSTSFRQVLVYRAKIKDLKAAVVTAILSILESVTTPYVPGRLLSALDTGPSPLPRVPPSSPSTRVPPPC